MELPKYKYNGARSLVMLHEIHIKSFLETWRQAKQSAIKLPETSDPDYRSMEALLTHVLRSAGGYIIWICRNLKLPDPLINPVPEMGTIETEAGRYIEHLAERWNLPLVEIEEDRFHDPVYKSNWGVDYCIDAILEHAVMHPIRHEFQLQLLIKKSAQTSS